MAEFASYIDHSLLKPDAAYTDIDKLCAEAIRFGFAAVCIPPVAVSRAREILRGKNPKLATVIGFPLGYSAVNSKLAEIQKAIADGADELDVVINLMALKSGDWPFLETEMREIVCKAHDQRLLVKVIIESGILLESEIIRCCVLYGKLGVDFLKTSTGYSQKGATVDAVRLMRKHLPDSVRIKASGGIRTYAFAMQLIEAGASRLGCSSGVALLKESKKEST